jgi:hypothetical protein
MQRKYIARFAASDATGQGYQGGWAHKQATYARRRYDGKEPEGPS